MNWLIILSIYLIIGIAVYLIALKLYKKKEGVPPTMYLNPIVMVTVVLIWPILLVVTISRNIFGR